MGGKCGQVCVWIPGRLVGGGSGGTSALCIQQVFWKSVQRQLPARGHPEGGAPRPVLVLTWPRRSKSWGPEASPDRREGSGW